MRKFYDHNAPDEFDGEEGPSKSLRKRQSHDLQALGEELIALPQEELDAMPLPDVLRDAVMLARRITAHGGLYRQKQFIGKLMRKIDADPIRAAIDARRDEARAATRQFHAIERWRTRLLEDAKAIDDFCETFPHTDRTLLARLVSQAAHEKANERPPRAARELFSLVEQAVKQAGDQP